MACCCYYVPNIIINHYKSWNQCPVILYPPKCLTPFALCLYPIYKIKPKACYFQMDNLSWPCIQIEMTTIEFFFQFELSTVHCHGGSIFAAVLSRGSLAQHLKSKTPIQVTRLNPNRVHNTLSLR